MHPAGAFAIFLALTVVLLTLVVWSGYARRRALHFTLVALALVNLGVSIYFAVKLGPYLDLKAAGLITPVHLYLARVTTFLYALPLVTGLATLRNSTWRPWHRRAAFLVLGMTVLTTVTGAWMLYRALPAH